jgi:hypothetical protein
VFLDGLGGLPTFAVQGYNKEKDVLHGSQHI